MAETVTDAREMAYLYDLYIVPGWREVFDRIVDEEIKFPEEGRFLEVECGTGGFAIDMAARGGHKVEVVAVDSDPERLSIAKGKAEIRKFERIEFQQAEATRLDFPDNSFDFVLADLSLLPVESIPKACEEIVRVAGKGAPVVIKLSTRGSFDEFFSIFWEALYELDLITCTPQLEALVNERLTVSDAEQIAHDAGLRDLRTFTRKERFDYQNARAFLDSPLISSLFLDHWTSIIPDVKSRSKLSEKLIKIIDRERHDMDFDISIKATVIGGKKK
ncbi:MAG: class I SAM-dependent methyltransferase [Acidobacteriota bacterium]|nr:MAG: class I SAM-dependent methyltransferase [Acidobacteriota bacterium]